jgi:uncharacterized membrane protein
VKEEIAMHMVTAGVVLGVGMGAFIDGILLHQIAQWHNMGSAIVPPITMDAMSRNMMWDGQFHLLSWFITLGGIIALWRDRGLSAPTMTMFVGQMIMGWGLFNLVEGVVDHHLLQIHHVRDLPLHIPAYDFLFLAVAGFGFVAAGFALSRWRGLLPTN